jgi:ribosomal protein L1
MTAKKDVKKIITTGRKGSSKTRSSRSELEFPVGKLSKILT